MDIIGNGVDIIKNSRIDKSLKIKGFINRIFTKQEIKQGKKIKNKINFFAKRFAAKEAFVKAIGSAEGTGRLVGTSIGASAAPSLANIPYIGWVAAGWVAMFGGNQGADIGGNMAEDLNKNC